MLEGAGVAAAIGELDPVVGQHGVQSVGYRGDQVAQELSRGQLTRLVNQPRNGQLAGPIDGYEQVELAFSGVPRRCRCEKSRWASA